jgi:hypothetical protein
MRAAAAGAIILLLCTTSLAAQTISRRGFVEGRASGFFRVAATDSTRAIGDVLLREEVFIRPSRWIQFGAGLDLRGHSYDQVDDQWRFDFHDRGARRPRAAIRRLSASLTAGAFSLDVGKQFIRWGRAEILNPADRFAPRDFLGLVEPDLLPVTGVRPSVQIGQETFEAVWVPRLTPSRSPLLHQRWTVVPPEAANMRVEDRGAVYPRGSQLGFQWRHTGTRVEAALSYFDGYNHLPAIAVRPLAPDAAELTRVYPALRTYGGHVVVPTHWLTLTGDAAYFTSPDADADEYALYVVEVARQAGEWLLVGGYAGEIVTTSRPSLSFAPDRGIARSIVGRVSRAADPQRTLVVEAVVRQNGDGVYVKVEHSTVVAPNWRLTMAGVGLAGDADDFLGQYRRNSHGSITLRFSF